MCVRKYEPMSGCHRSSQQWPQGRNNTAWRCLVSRFIGIRHRVKKTAAGEAHPTQVVINDGGSIVEHELADEDAELDFMLGRFPLSMRNVRLDENLSGILPRHVQWHRIEEGEDLPKQIQKLLGEGVTEVPENLILKADKDTLVAVKVPTGYDGLKAADTVGMMLGGSGDNLAFALSRRADEIGASVLRIPPFEFKKHRAVEDDKAQDAHLLAQLVQTQSALFYQVTTRDRLLINVREGYRARTEAMKARIACDQRLRQHVIGEIFRSEEGKYPEGSIEARYNEAKANDVILKNLLDEEHKREKELTTALGRLEVYTKIFEPIEGVGPMIAARIISCIPDIRLFPTKPKFRKFLGVHVADGRFPRRRRGEVANWSPDSRQAFYLLGDQFNRRPNSEWGKRLLLNKQLMKERHPEVVVVNGKKRYTRGHLWKMALWRTRTQFANHLYNKWWDLENGNGGKQTEEIAA
jgi:hypothetical protein